MRLQVKLALHTFVGYLLTVETYGLSFSGCVELAGGGHFIACGTTSQDLVKLWLFQASQPLHCLS